MNCKRISLEQMHIMPDSEKIYIEFADVSHEKCEISQFQLYEKADFRYLVNNIDENNDYFSLIAKTRYLLLSTPE